MKNCKRNLELRKEIAKSQLTHWFIAEQLGVSAVTFSCWLRKELSEEVKTQIRSIIEKSKEE